MDYEEYNLEDIQYIKQFFERITSPSFEMEKFFLPAGKTFQV